MGVANGTGKFFAFPAVEESVILCLMAKNLVGNGALLPHLLLFALQAQGEQEGRE